MTRKTVLYSLRVSLLEKARHWLRSQRRGNERAGLLASSNAARLKPHGIFVKARIEPTKWFLAPGNDVRSSDALEDAATEFDVQGLELDWACLCWDANLRRGSSWETWRFKGSQWNGSIIRHAKPIWPILSSPFDACASRSRGLCAVWEPRRPHPTACPVRQHL
jgi:hypothetical protein